MKKQNVGIGVILLLCIASLVGTLFLAGIGFRIPGPQGIQGNVGEKGDKGYSVDLPKLYKQVSSAVVWIGAERDPDDDGYPYYQWMNEDIKWQGTGFLVTPCLIATAGHVVEDTKTFEIQFQDGSRAKADFVYMESLDRCDVGFIRLQKEYRKERPYFNFNTNIEIGEDVIIVGYPWGLNKGPTLTKGVVSLLNRDVPFFGTKPMIHTDTAAWSGNSGSPVIDMNGKCIGIFVGLKIGYDNFSVCTPAKLVELVMQKAIAEIELREIK